ncbi:MAG: hypothetical protein KDJ49_04090 [Alphaproteobacteria bacterium]|nr:hypothetical protein [Alphaproteobacteria bacterium]USO07654.1 MAG: hypothetical protein H6866_09660 [Rhodospirillales bacterium]
MLPDIMRLLIIALLTLLVALPARALEPPSAMPSGLPEAAIAKAREAADYSVVVDTGKWESGPSFATGQVKWYLGGRIVSEDFQHFAPAGADPIKAGGTILIIPYCAQGSASPQGGPGQGCAAFVNRRVRVWGLLADMHARKMPDGRMLIQAENLLDAAFVP